MIGVSRSACAGAGRLLMPVVLGAAAGVLLTAVVPGAALAAVAAALVASVAAIWLARRGATRGHGGATVPREIRDLMGHVPESLPGIVYLLDDAGRLVHWNRHFARASGIDDTGIEGRNALDFVAEDHRPQAAAALEAVMVDGEVTVQADYLSKDGPRPYIFTARRVQSGGRSYVVGTGFDVTQWVQMENDLRRQTETLQRIIDNIPIMLCFIDAERRLRLVNREWVRVLGWSLEEAQDLSIFTRLYPDPAQRRQVFEHIAAAGEEWQEYRTTVRDGRVIDTAWTTVGQPDGTIIGIGQDISELKRTREELYQAQKMESIGRLSAGIAHDFNNLLVPILGYLDHSIDRLGAASPVRSDLTVVRSAANRAAELTRQILAFSRQQFLELQVLDVNAAIAEFQTMLGRLLGEEVELVTHLADDLGPIKADKGQIEQVLMNLAVNARDAMPGGGRLIVETRSMELSADYLRRHLRVDHPPGPHVVLSVTDNGTGMDAAIQAQIFEPFFTNKERGRGTGLGLSTVFGIVKQHQGYIAVDSELGRGTTFRIYLPCCEGRPAAPGPAEIPAESGEAGERGRAVLVVEDDVLVRQLVCDALATHGYRIIEAGNPADAIERARSHAGDIDLLLSDVVMPGLGGQQVYRRVADHNPGIRVLFMSGYTADTAGDLGDPEAVWGFLHKPFTVAALRQKVDDLLAGPGRPLH